MNDDREALGIPPGAHIYSGSNQLPEGWTEDWIGVRLSSLPPRPWPWPYIIIRRGRKVWLVLQVWRSTLIRPGFAYSVLWHPQHGRSYQVESNDPDIADLVKEAQGLLRRERRGRQRHRPTPEQYCADFDKIERGAGRPPSRRRMADEYDVNRDTVRKWLQRPDWSKAVPDKYRAE